MPTFNPTTAYPGGNKFTNVAGAATTVISGAPATLVAIVCNKAVLSGVITIYDNATTNSGTKVGTITHPATLLQNQYVLPYGADMANGIVVVTSAADDITVIYRT